MGGGGYGLHVLKASGNMCLKMPIADKFIMCGQNCCKISQLLIVVFGVSSAALFMFDLLTISV